MSDRSPPRHGVEAASRTLRSLAGVDEDVLAQVSSERPRYTALGGVVLGTATIAALSMATALSQAFPFAPVLTLLLLALGWGLFVLNLDRWLVSSTTETRWRSRVGMLLPRLVLAAVLGVIIAEPIVLRIFETAVVRHIQDGFAQERAGVESALRVCNGLESQSQAEQERPDCSGHQINLAGVATPQSLEERLQGLGEEKATLDEQIAADTSRLAAMQQFAREECNGTPGSGRTGRVGEGPNCLEDRRQAAQFEQDHDIAGARRESDALGSEIQQVQRDLAAANDHYEAAVSAEITRRLEDLDRRQEGIGLLERFGALHELISENWFLFLARWFLTGFFVLIDCLPVFVKLFGGITFYERLLHDRLTAAEQVFNEDTRTGAAEQIVKARTRRYQAEVQEQTSRDDIDHRGRITAAHREAELDQETAKLIEQYRAQHRTDHQGDDANGQTRAGMGEPRGLG